MSNQPESTQPAVVRTPLLVQEDGGQYIPPTVPPMQPSPTNNVAFQQQQQQQQTTMTTTPPPPQPPQVSYSPSQAQPSVMKPVSSPLAVQQPITTSSIAMSSSSSMTATSAKRNVPMSFKEKFVKYLPLIISAVLTFLAVASIWLGTLLVMGADADDAKETGGVPRDYWWLIFLMLPVVFQIVTLLNGYDVSPITFELIQPMSISVGLSSLFYHGWYWLHTLRWDANHSLTKNGDARSAGEFFLGAGLLVLVVAQMVTYGANLFAIKQQKKQSTYHY